MSSIKLKGSTSGDITISAPAVAGTNTLTLPANSGEITVGGNNTPYFSVRMSADQTATDNSWTKVDFDTVIMESGVTFDTTNNRFTVPSGAGGIYQINAHIAFQSTVNADIAQCYARYYLNGAGTTGTPVYNFAGNLTAKQFAVQYSRIIPLSEGDYVEMYGFCNVVSGTLTFDTESRWAMHKLIT